MTSLFLGPGVRLISLSYATIDQLHLFGFFVRWITYILANIKDPHRIKNKYSWKYSIRVIDVVVFGSDASLVA